MLRMTQHDKNMVKKNNISYGLACCHTLTLTRMGRLQQEYYEFHTIDLSNKFKIQNMPELKMKTILKKKVLKINCKLRGYILKLKS